MSRYVVKFKIKRRHIKMARCAFRLSASHARRNRYLFSRSIALWELASFGKGNKR